MIGDNLQYRQCGYLQWLGLVVQPLHHHLPQSWPQNHPGWVKVEVQAAAPALEHRGFQPIACWAAWVSEVISMVAVVVRWSSSVVIVVASIRVER